MKIKTPGAFARSIVARTAAAAWLLVVATYAHSAESDEPLKEQSAPRAQLSIGYSLLYQEADGIPKLKWLLNFKEKSQEMGTLTDELINYYKQLAGNMEKLSKQYPAMRINVKPMSTIEGDTRKSIGEDLAKDIAPLAGKSGVQFEREALLTFYDSLNEQRHLTRVMGGLETNARLKKFLDKTNMELDSLYAKVGALLNRRYFTH